MDTSPPNNQPSSEETSSRVKNVVGLASLEAVAGRQAALTIIRNCAGRELLVRACPHPGDEISKLIGLDVAQAIADELLGDDEGDQLFFINAPLLFASEPGAPAAPVNGAVASPAERPLEGVLGRIEILCGRDVALKIAAYYGGARLFLPTRVTSKSVIVQVVGEKAAQALIDEFGPDTYLNISTVIYGSSTLRRDLGMKLLREGYSKATVVRLLKVARSVVFEWSKKIKEEQK